MSYSLPPGAMPPPEPLAVALVAAMLPDADVQAAGARLDRKNPAMRVRLTVVRDVDVPTEWQRAPVLQVDVWSDDILQAQYAAATLAHLWRTGNRKGRVGAGFVSGRWVEREPYLLPPVTETDSPRYLLEIGFRFHPGETHG